VRDERSGDLDAVIDAIAAAEAAPVGPATIRAMLDRVPAAMTSSMQREAGHIRRPRQASAFGEPPLVMDKPLVGGSVSPGSRTRCPASLAVRT
jgi:hypothetical protein